MTYRSIYWDGDQARLKSFSATSKSGSCSVVKIEIEVRDPFRLGSMLQDLEEIHRAQVEAARPSPAAKPKRDASRRREIPVGPAPLLLTYRED
jgi:hypothetical protein